MNQEVMEGNSVILCCELNKPAPSVEWRRGIELLKNGNKYQMRKKELQVEMKITDVSLNDTGDYTCICGEQMTKALITVNGECYSVFIAVNLIDVSKFGLVTVQS